MRWSLTRIAAVAIAHMAGPSPRRRVTAFGSWRDRLPEGFRLAVKAPRGLTHARKLYAPEAWLQRIAAGSHELGDKRGGAAGSAAARPAA